MPAPGDDELRRVLSTGTDTPVPTTHDTVDPAVPVAATVVLLRDGADGPETLMIERPDRGSFAGAWVFPGGKVEEQDTGDSELDVARSAAVRETVEETGLIVDPDALQLLSRWNPPMRMPLRIRTWFFLARDPGGATTPQADEAVSERWLRPADALERHGRGELTLYPPTWVTLFHLARQSDVDDILAQARLHGPELFESVARRAGDTRLLVWHGDEQYDLDPPGASGHRHRLDMTRRPWVYTRTP